MALDPRALVTLAEARDWLNTLPGNTGGDTDIEQAINAVSQRIHQEAEREFKVAGTNPQTRLFPITDAAGGQPWYVDGVYLGTIGAAGRTVAVGDLTSFTSVSLLSAADWTTVLATPTVGGGGAQVRGLPLVKDEWAPFDRLEFRPDVISLGPGIIVSVAGTWGFPAIPASIKQACLDGIAWVMDRDVEHYRTDLGSVGGEHGPVIMMSGGAQRILSLPPEVLAVCWAFREHLVG